MIIALGVIIQGIVDSDKISGIYEACRDDDRLQFFVATGNVTVRVDTVSAWLGQLFISLSQYGCQQNFMQRFRSFRTVRRQIWYFENEIKFLGFIQFELPHQGTLSVYTSTLHILLSAMVRGYGNLQRISRL